MYTCRFAIWQSHIVILFGVCMDLWNRNLYVSLYVSSNVCFCLQMMFVSWSFNFGSRSNAKKPSPTSLSFPCFYGMIYPPDSNFWYSLHHSTTMTTRRLYPEARKFRSSMLDSSESEGEKIPKKWFQHLRTTTRIRLPLNHPDEGDKRDKGMLRNRLLAPMTLQLPTPMNKMPSLFQRTDCSLEAYLSNSERKT